MAHRFHRTAAAALGGAGLTLGACATTPAVPPTPPCSALRASGFVKDLRFTKLEATRAPQLVLASLTFGGDVRAQFDSVTPRAGYVFIIPTVSFDVAAVACEDQFTPNAVPMAPADLALVSGDGGDLPCFSEYESPSRGMAWSQRVGTVHYRPGRVTERRLCIVPQPGVDAVRIRFFGRDMGRLVDLSPPPDSGGSTSRR